MRSLPLVTQLITTASMGLLFLSCLVATTVTVVRDHEEGGPAEETTRTLAPLDRSHPTSLLLAGHPPPMVAE